MRLLVDEQLPVEICELFGSIGHDAQHVYQRRLRGLDDGAVWREAQALGAVIVSKDRDFRERRRASPGPSVVWVRLPNMSKAHLIACFAERWPAVERQLLDGEAIVEMIR